MEEPVADLSHIQNAEVKRQVEELLINYTPTKPEKSCIEMKLILENDIPVHCRP